MKPLLHILLVCCFALVASAKGKRHQQSELELVSASYGLEQERIIVTDLLRPLLAHGFLLLRAPWGFGDPDPKPGSTKDVVIVYRYQGREATATFKQDEDILFPPAPKGLSIVSASYGVAGSRVDATVAVRAAVKDAAIKQGAGWELGRVDPAQGKIKTVEITYIYEGHLQSASFRQDQNLVLP